MQSRPLVFAATAAAALYALQHRFSKPLANHLSGSLIATMQPVLLNEAVLVLAFAALLFGAGKPA